MERRACNFILLVCLTLLQAIAPLLHDHIDGVYSRTGLHAPGLGPESAGEHGVPRPDAVAGLHAPAFAGVSLGESSEVALGPLVEPAGRLAVHSNGLDVAAAMRPPQETSLRSGIRATAAAVFVPEPAFAFWPPGRAPPAG